MKSIFIFIFILFLLYTLFHRSPSFISQNNDNIIYSPAFGKIIAINYNNNYIHIIIFLSPLDVHIQYIPINGIILNQIYDRSGKYNLAYKINKSNNNEKLITILKPNINIPNIYIYQIAGKYVRRIKSYISFYPQKVLNKQKLGIIKLGSRVDLILPSQNLHLLVKNGDKVYGPNTIIGFYKN